MQPHIASLGDYGGFIERSTFDPKNCSVWITVEIGLGEGNGADQFNVQVVTPEYLRLCKKPMWGKSILIVESFTWEEVEESIRELLSGISADNWDDATKILTRYMNWEFDGM